MTDAAADPVARAASAVARAVSLLSLSNARTEALAELVPERRVLGITRAARLTAVGRVSRLGVLPPAAASAARTGRVPLWSR